MNGQQLETLAPTTKKQEPNLFVGVRNVGLLAGALTISPIFLPALTPLLAILAVVAWIATGSLWTEAKETRSGVVNVNASIVWQEVNHISRFGENPTPEERALFQQIETIYQRDPYGKFLPLSQAVQLTLAWKQQQDRLLSVERDIKQIRADRTALRTNQKLLHELNDDDPDLEQAIARLKANSVPLERSRDLLRASCLRLESLLDEVDDAIRRHELHREIDKITSRSSTIKSSSPFNLSPDDLDLERQITREIETYLQLERETDAQLHDL